MRRLLVAGAAAALFLGATGCTASSDGSSQDPVPGTGAAPTSGTDLLRGRVLPLLAYQESPEQAQTYDRARTILENDCLAEYGLEGLPHREPPRPEPRMYRIYGVVHPTVAAEWGYHLDEVGQASSADTSSSGSISKLSGPLMTVLLGGGDGPVRRGATPTATATYGGKPIPTRGCRGQASDRLDDVEIDGSRFTLAQELGVEAFDRAEADPRVVEVTAHWSTCMAGRGYHAPDPFEASSFDMEGPVTQAEIDTALADVACKEETGFVDVWFDVESEYEQKLIQENFEVLTEVKAALEARAARAAEVVTSAGGE